MGVLKNIRELYHICEYIRLWGPDYVQQSRTQTDHERKLGTGINASLSSLRRSSINQYVIIEFKMTFNRYGPLSVGL